jgi:hypothetical protein
MSTRIYKPKEIHADIVWAVIIGHAAIVVGILILAYATESNPAKSRIGAAKTTKINVVKSCPTAEEIEELKTAKELIEGTSEPKPVIDSLKTAPQSQPLFIASVAINKPKAFATPRPKMSINKPKRPIPLKILKRAVGNQKARKKLQAFLFDLYNLA